MSEPLAQMCTRLALCSLNAGHDGECVVLGSPSDRDMPEWDRKTRDPRGWRDRRRYR